MEWLSTKSAALFWFFFGTGWLKFWHPGSKKYPNLRFWSCFRRQAAMNTMHRDTTTTTDMYYGEI